MILTGVFLSLTISCKMVGLFAFLTVGSAVLLDLWNLLDYRRGLTIASSIRALGFFFFSLADLSSTSQDQVARHFMARAFGLIIVPAMVYLFWFWVHFRVLNRSGTGDEFMSPAFQQTLLESPLTLNAEGEE